MTGRTDRRGVYSWLLFDWANQPYYTLIMTFIFAPYFAASVAADPAEGQAIWANVVAVAGLCVAVMAPLLGAVADAYGPRKPWMAGFALLFMVGCIGLWLAEPGADPIWPILAMFLLAYVGSEFMLIFYNAMLPDLGPRSEIGKLSGYGWALGYVGGVVVLILVLVLLSPTPGSQTTLAGIPPLFGLDPDAGEPARATGPLTALWFAIFAVPLFLFTPDSPRKSATKGIVRQGVRDLIETLRTLPGSGPLIRYLFASMIYRDALAGLFIFGGIYASGVLGWGPFQLGIFGIIAAVIGAVGAWLAGRADWKYGPKPVIMASIILLIMVSCVVLLTSRGAVAGIPVAADSTLPDIVFYICGGLIGAAGAGVQASSRTLLIHVAEDRASMTEAFGLYALSGKATAFLAPLLIGIATTATGSQSLGISPVILLFAIGLTLLYFVKTTEA